MEDQSQSNDIKKDAANPGSWTMKLGRRLPSRSSSRTRRPILRLQSQGAPAGPKKDMVVTPTNRLTIA